MTTSELISLIQKMDPSGKLPVWRDGDYLADPTPVAGIATETALIDDGKGERMDILVIK